MTKEPEDPRPTYFCWVRVVDISSMTTPAPVYHFPPSKQDGRAHFRHWDVPNQQITSKVAKKSEPTGVWSVVDGFFGRASADTAFDFGPAFVEEGAAINWIAGTHEGQRWDKESLNRFLFRFELY